MHSSCDYAVLVNPGAFSARVPWRSRVDHAEQDNQYMGKVLAQHVHWTCRKSLGSIPRSCLKALHWQAMWRPAANTDVDGRRVCWGVRHLPMFQVSPVRLLPPRVPKLVGTHSQSPMPWLDVLPDLPLPFPPPPPPQSLNPRGVRITQYAAALLSWLLLSA